MQRTVTPRTAQRRSPHRRSHRGRGLRRSTTVATVVVAFVASLLVKVFVLQAYVIPSGSMENTLQVHDRVVTNRLSYQLHDIHRGDVVVFSGAGTWDGPAPAASSSVIVRVWHDFAVRAGIDSAAGTIYVKRVIGLPGDTVACCDSAGQVTVNGVALDESSYIDDDSFWSGRCPKPPAQVSARCFGPVKVPAGMLWVLGDHRRISEDSRRHLEDPGGGAVESSQVVGKAVLVVWPLSHWRTLGTPTTFAGVPTVAMAIVPVLPSTIVLSTMFLLSWRRRWRHGRWMRYLPRHHRRPGQPAALRDVP